MDFSNTIGKSFDIHFCQLLEYHLSAALKNASTNKFEHIWCDGIEVPEAWNQPPIDLKESKQIITGAWLGLTGQDKYQMIIKLGEISLDRCSSGININDCLPDGQSLDWIDIDLLNRRIVLQLV
jgi:hypothetical protein